MAASLVIFLCLLALVPVTMGASPYGTQGLTSCASFGGSPISPQVSKRLTCYSNYFRTSVFSTGPVETFEELIVAASTLRMVNGFGRFTSLKRMLLVGTHNQLRPTIYPHTFMNIPNLEELFISKVYYSGYPLDQLRSLSKLRTLEVSQLYKKSNYWNSLSLRLGVFPTSLVTLKMDECRINGIQVGGLFGNIQTPFSNLTNLEKLTLANNKISILYGVEFYGLSSLTFLDLSSNQIATMNTGVFSSLTKLKSLMLTNNKISILSGGEFNGLSSLTFLNLSSNRIANINNGVFSSLTTLNLNSLDLSGNNMTSLPPGLFTGLSHLQSLKLTDAPKSGQQYYESLHPGVFPDSLVTLKMDACLINEIRSDCIRGGSFRTPFSNLTKLEKLTFTNNMISKLNGEEFNDLSSLTFLDLSSNRIATINTGVFSSLTMLNSLDLSGNSMTRLPPDAFAGLSRLQSLSLLSGSLSLDDVNVFTPLLGLRNLYLNNNRSVQTCHRVFCHLQKNITFQLVDSCQPTSQYCAEVKERTRCQKMGNPCHRNAICTASATCKCKPEFFGNGSSCVLREYACLSAHAKQLQVVTVDYRKQPTKHGADLCSSLNLHLDISKMQHCSVEYFHWLRKVDPEEYLRAPHGALRNAISLFSSTCASPLELCKYRTVCTRHSLCYGGTAHVVKATGYMCRCPTHGEVYNYATKTCKVACKGSTKYHDTTAAPWYKCVCNQHGHIYNHATSTCGVACKGSGSTYHDTTAAPWYKCICNHQLGIFYNYTTSTCKTTCKGLSTYHVTTAAPGYKCVCNQLAHVYNYSTSTCDGPCYGGGIYREMKAAPGYKCVCNQHGHIYNSTTSTCEAHCLNVTKTNHDLRTGKVGENAVVSCKPGYNLTTVQPPVCVLQSNGIAKWTEPKNPCLAETTCGGQTIFIGPDMKWNNWRDTFNFADAQESCYRGGGHIVSKSSFYHKTSNGSQCLIDFFNKTVFNIAPRSFSNDQNLTVQFWLDGCIGGKNVSRCPQIEISKSIHFAIKRRSTAGSEHTKFTPAAICQRAYCPTIDMPTYYLLRGEIGDRGAVSCKHNYTRTMQPIVCVLRSNGTGKWNGSSPCYAETICGSRSVFFAPDLKWADWDNTYNYSAAQASCSSRAGGIVVSSTFSHQDPYSADLLCVAGFFKRTVYNITPSAFSNHTFIKVRFWLHDSEYNVPRMLDFPQDTSLTENSTVHRIGEPPPAYNQFIPAAICQMVNCPPVDTPTYHLRRGDVGDRGAVSCKPGYNLTTVPPVCVLRTSVTGKWNGSISCYAEKTCGERTVFVGQDFKWNNWDDTFNYAEAQATCYRAGGHIVSKSRFYSKTSIGSKCLNDFFWTTIANNTPTSFTNAALWFSGCVQGAKDTRCAVIHFMRDGRLIPNSDAPDSYKDFIPAAICQKALCGKVVTENYIMNEGQPGGRAKTSCKNRYLLTTTTPPPVCVFQSDGTAKWIGRVPCAAETSCDGRIVFAPEGPPIVGYSYTFADAQSECYRRGGMLLSPSPFFNKTQRASKCLNKFVREISVYLKHNQLVKFWVHGCPDRYHCNVVTLYRDISRPDRFETHAGITNSNIPVAICEIAQKNRCGDRQIMAATPYRVGNLANGYNFWEANKSCIAAGARMVQSKYFFQNNSMGKCLVEFVLGAFAKPKTAYTKGRVQFWLDGCSPTGCKIITVDNGNTNGNAKYKIDRHVSTAKAFHHSIPAAICELKPHCTQFVLPSVYGGELATNLPSPLVRCRKGFSPTPNTVKCIFNPITGQSQWDVSLAFCAPNTLICKAAVIYDGYMQEGALGQEYYSYRCNVGYLKLPWAVELLRCEADVNGLPKWSVPHNPCQRIQSDAACRIMDANSHNASCCTPIFKDKYFFARLTCDEKFHDKEIRPPQTKYLDFGNWKTPAQARRICEKQGRLVSLPTSTNYDCLRRYLKLLRDNYVYNVEIQAALQPWMDARGFSGTHQLLTNSTAFLPEGTSVKVPVICEYKSECQDIGSGFDLPRAQGFWHTGDYGAKRQCIRCLANDWYDRKNKRCSGSPMVACGREGKIFTSMSSAESLIPYGSAEEQKEFCERHHAKVPGHNVGRQRGVAVWSCIEQLFKDFHRDHPELIYTGYVRAGKTVPEVVTKHNDIQYSRTFFHEIGGRYHSTLANFVCHKPN